MVTVMNFYLNKKIDEIVEEFLDFIKNKRLIIHNAQFDLSHLNNELTLIGKNKIDQDVVDTLELAREKFPGSDASLDALCKKYNIDNSKREKHNAIMDCELLSKVYINLLDQKEPNLKLNTDSDFKDETEDSANYKYLKRLSNQLILN